MPTFAAVDIGANSVRLKIARLRHGRLTTIAEDREVTRLGEAVFQQGMLSHESMENTVKVLRRFHRTVQQSGADHVRVVATSALRDAANAQAVVDWVHSSTGWTIEIISGLEEGRLIHLAVMSGLAAARAGRVLLFDLGGGSCEVTISNDAEIASMVSLPLGAVRLTREFLKHDPPKPKEMRRLCGFVTEEIGRMQGMPAGSTIHSAIGTSGTAAALAGLWKSRRRGQPTTVPRAAVADFVDELARYSYAERAALPGIGTRRAEIIIAGAVVFSTLLDHIELPSFRYSALGLRDGLLAQMAGDYDAGTAFHRRIESERRIAVAGVAKRYAVDSNFAARVRTLALELFDSLKSVHQLPAEYRDWLAAAASLHEVGAFVNRAGRHRHTYYLLSHTELFGFTSEQREIIAAIARYVGKSRPTPESRPVRVLPPADQVCVRKAVILLRLARALDQSRSGRVKSIRARAVSGKVSLEIEAKRGGADLELWAVEKERRYFREAFGRELLPAVV